MDKVKTDKPNLVVLAIHEDHGFDWYYQLKGDALKKVNKMLKKAWNESDADEFKLISAKKRKIGTFDSNG